MSTPWNNVGPSAERGVSATAQHPRELVLASVVTEVPTIMVVRQGRKKITRGSLTLRLNAGDAVVVPTGQAFTLTNTPLDGEFVATMYSPATHLIAEIVDEYAHVPAIRNAYSVPRIETEFLASFDRAVMALADPSHLPQSIVEHREREVLIWLAHHGLKFDRGDAADLAHVLRTAISDDLTRRWKVRDIARHLAMSEATLRRRLHEQGLSFQQLVIDVRMTRALFLLQVTHLPIQQIALDVGYDSASRFAARFKQRFDISPSAVRP